MDPADFRNEILETKLKDVFYKCERELSELMDANIAANNDAYMVITRQEEMNVWRMFVHVNHYIISNFLPGEPKLNEDNLYMIPQLMIAVDFNAEFYDLYKNFTAHVYNFFGLIPSRKTEAVLKTILNKLNCLAMYYRRMATMREIRRREAEEQAAALEKKNKEARWKGG